MQQLIFYAKYPKTKETNCNIITKSKPISNKILTGEGKCA